MRVAVLGSGSRGNSVVVETGGRRLLIDAGFSCRRIEKRLASLGVEASSVDALLLTHEHRDHCTGADVLLRRHRLPVFATEGTLRDAGLSEEAAARSRPVRSGEPFEVAGFQVEPFAIPHDAREPVGFVVEDSAGRRLGLASDMGCRSSLAWGRLRELDILILETNHDLQMLRTGPYPWSLKQRVAGRFGHLSNHDAADGLPDLLSSRLSTLVLYHLSQTNNLPELAAETIGERIDREGSRARIVVASQETPSPWLEVDKASRPITQPDRSRNGPCVASSASNLTTTRRI